MEDLLSVQPDFTQAYIILHPSGSSQGLRLTAHLLFTGEITSPYPLIQANSCKPSATSMTYASKRSDSHGDATSAVPPASDSDRGAKAAENIGTNSSRTLPVLAPKGPTEEELKKAHRQAQETALDTPMTYDERVSLFDILKTNLQQEIAKGELASAEKLQKVNNDALLPYETRRVRTLSGSGGRCSSGAARSGDR